jgi:hypothetical protein
MNFKPDHHFPFSGVTFDYATHALPHAILLEGSETQEKIKAEA